MDYIKAILALVVAAVGSIVSVIGNGDLGDLGAKEWIFAVLAVVGSAGWVWLCENVPGVFGGAIKTIGAFLTAGLGSLVFALDDNVISQGEWLTAFSIALVASGLVYQIPNAPPPNPPTA